MTSAHTSRLLALGMVLLSIAIGSLVSAQMAEHSLHHAHHDGATHATVLCTWICAAGEVHSSIVVTVVQPIWAVEYALSPFSSRHSPPAQISHAGRDPPSSLI